MPYGFLCCGPSTVHNVVDTSDEEDSDSSGDYEARVSGMHVPGGSGDPRDGSGQRRRLRRGASGRSGSSGSEEEVGFIGWMASAFFSPRPRRRRPSYRKSKDPSVMPLFVGGQQSGAAVMEATVAVNPPAPGRRAGSDPTVLNLAYRETIRLPDVAGRERGVWAAGILRIDLTETGIRTLRGLDEFPNVQTLILDGNGLVSLPDCPWVPSLETLWLCNNDIDNLEGLLCQINDTFPRLTSLALMGNPAWLASYPSSSTNFLAVGAATATEPPPARRNRGHKRRSSDEAERAGGHSPFESSSSEDCSREGEAAYRIRVLRRLPGLQTLDCVDVTEEERERTAWQEQQHAEQPVVKDLVTIPIEPEVATDVEESLPSSEARSTMPTVHGVGKMLEDERKRRRGLADRSTLPSTWTKEAVVMDVGSGWSKMGLAGQDKPSCMFPSVVGRMDLRAYDHITGQEERVYVGHEAINEANKRIAERELPSGRGPMPRPILLNRPLEGGVVVDWDDMEEIWRHGIEDVMKLQAVEHPVLMADSTSTPVGAREKATEILFETLASPAMHMALEPVLALYACGPSSGLVVDIGDSGTQIAPIFDGFLLERGVRQLSLGGKDVTKQLAASVNAKIGLLGGAEFDTEEVVDMLKLEGAKSKLCFVSENVDKDNARMELSMTKPYVLPDGTRITLGRERYRCSEILFDPAMALRQEASLQTSILDSILACDKRTRPLLAQTVILTGGTSELQGLNRRLQRELTKARRASGIKMKFTVMVPEDDHNHTVWLGGSLLASTGQLDGLWFTRAEYEEYGAGPIHAKFAA